MKRIVIAGIAVICLVGIYFVWAKSSGSGDSASKYRLAVVDRGAVRSVVTATGTVSAVTTVQVGSQVSGILTEILVDFNSPVKKGQIIARLDPTFLQASVTENEANLERAKATLQQAERDLARVTDLTAKNLAAQVDADNAQTALETARASVKQAEAQLERAKVNLAYSVIRSPIDGVVINRAVDVGQTVAASLQAPELFTIAQDLREMQVQTNIDEADIGRLHEGMEASFTVDSYPDLTFRAKIQQVRYAAQEDQSVVTYPVILQVENPELKLRPGMTANVTVVVDEAENTLRFPASALRFRPANNGEEKSKIQNAKSDSESGRARGAGSDSTRMRKRMSGDSTAAGDGGKDNFKSGATVYVKGPNSEPVAKRIQTGINDGSYVQVVSGEVAQGDSVIIGLVGTSARSSSSMMPGMGGGPGRR